MNLFSRQTASNAPVGTPDKILEDLPRGEKNRPRNESSLPYVFFEPPEILAQVGFKDGGADIYLGAVEARTVQVTRADGRSESKTTGGFPIGNRDDRHLTTIAGTRSGKGRSAIIPNLLCYGGSVLVIDPKGENASITARYRAKVLGHKVCVLDPFNKTTSSCDPYRQRYNPLTILRPESDTLIEDAGLIADALVVPSGGKDTHWDETAKSLIEGLILHTVTTYDEERRNLNTVADLLFGKHGPIKSVLDEMKLNESLDGIVSAAAVTMLEKGDSELLSVVSNARKNLRFLQYKSMQDVLAGHDFNLDELQKGKLTVYLVLPAMRLNTCAQWFRLFINLALAAAETAESRPKIPSLLVLDEFATLGPMQELERAIGQIAGFGLRIWVILQDLGQLKSLYNDRWETFLGNSGMIQCFGNVDRFTSDWISKYLDKTTITVTDVSETSADAKHSRGASGANVRLQLQDLMTAAEVRKYFARDDRYNRQLVLIPKQRPYILQRTNYDHHEFFAGRFDVWR